MLQQNNRGQPVLRAVVADETLQKVSQRLEALHIWDLENAAGLSLTA